MADTAPEDTGESVLKRIRSYLLKGTLVVLPVIVTIFVVDFALAIITHNLITPLTVFASEELGYGYLPDLFVEIVAPTLLLVVVFAIGVLSSVLPTGRLSSVFNNGVESIPGIGTVYGSVRQMSETIANGEEAFDDVKLIENPTKGTFTIAFVTADSPGIVEKATESDEPLTTLFMPMSPNPLMGGHVVYVPESKVRDIDISVEEGLQAVLTSGVTIDDAEGASDTTSKTQATP